MVGSCVADALFLCGFRVDSSDIKVRSNRIIKSNSVHQYARILGISYIVELSNVYTLNRFFLLLT